MFIPWSHPRSNRDEVVFFFSPTPFSARGSRSARAQAAGGRLFFPARLGEDCGKARFRAVHAILRDGQFQQTARQCPLRSDGGNACPSVRIRRGSSAAKKGRNPSCSRSSQAAEEVGCFLGPSSTCFEANDDEPAASRLLEFGVHLVAFTVSCRGQRRPGGGVRLQPRGAITAHWTDEGGVNCQLRSVIERQTVTDDFDGSIVDNWVREVHSVEGDIGCDARSRLPAYACQGSFEGNGAGAQDTRLRASRPMVAKDIQHAVTRAVPGADGEG